MFHTDLISTLHDLRLINFDPCCCIQAILFDMFIVYYWYLQLPWP